MATPWWNDIKDAFFHKLIDKEYKYKLNEELAIDPKAVVGQ